jgi:hypothetical protein
MTLLSLRKRKVAAQEQIDEAERERARVAREEEERRLAMQARVKQFCDQGFVSNLFAVLQCQDVI